MYAKLFIVVSKHNYAGNRRIPSWVAENDRIPSRLVLDGINISSIFIELQEASPVIMRIGFLC
jgi:hypothetical protein